MIIWLIGLSGSGKTTIGELLHKKITADNKNTIILDGDVMRNIWGDNLGHNIVDRRVNAERLSKLCKFLDSQGVNVIACVLSIFPEWQNWNRENFREYFEVFLNVPLDVVKARDAKGLYQMAEMGEITNVVGVDLDFPEPPNSDMELTMSQLSKAPEYSANIIYNKVIERM